MVSKGALSTSPQPAALTTSPLQSNMDLPSMLSGWGSWNYPTFLVKQPSAAEALLEHLSQPTAHDQVLSTPQRLIRSWQALARLRPSLTGWVSIQQHDRL